MTIFLGLSDEGAGNDPETSHKLGMCMFIEILSVFVHHAWLSTQIPPTKHILSIRARLTEPCLRN